MSVNRRTRKIPTSKRKEKRAKSKKRISKPRKSSKEKKNISNNPQRPCTRNDDITVEKGRLPVRRYEQFHDTFLNYDQIITFLEKVQKNKSGIVELMNIGYSGQGKPIFLVLLTSDSISTSTPRHVAFIEAGLNGEDAFAVSNALFIIDYLSKNPSYICLMDYFIIPCANPDAYDTFIKSKSTKACKVKRTRSYCDVASKRSRLQLPDRSTEPLKTNNNDSAANEVSTESESKKACPNGRKTGKTSSSKTEKTNSKGCQDPSVQEEKAESVNMDLSLNFPVVLGLHDMKRIPTSKFLDKIKSWKENYVNTTPETATLLRALNTCQFAIKLLISLQEGGESICYPYGFSNDVSEDTNDLQEIAKKGKTAITGRSFQYGSIYNIRGLTYGSLIDFVKVDQGSIKYTYIIQVHRKASNYNEKNELKRLMNYGCDIMKCVKSMSAGVYKVYTDMTGNRKVETASTKPGIEKKSPF